MIKEFYRHIWGPRTRPRDLFHEVYNTMQTDCGIPHLDACSKLAEAYIDTFFGEKAWRVITILTFNLGLLVGLLLGHK